MQIAKWIRLNGNNDIRICTSKMILCRETGKTKPQKTKDGDDGTYYRMAVGMSENAIEWMVVSCFVPTKRANITNSMDFFAFDARVRISLVPLF